jgi:hypothetical protein
MTPGGIAILSTCGLIAVALIGAWVELFKARRAQRDVVHHMEPNTGGSLRDAVDRAEAAATAIGGKLDRLSDQIHEVDRRLIRVETRTDLITQSAPQPRREMSSGQ